MSLTAPAIRARAIGEHGDPFAGNGSGVRAESQPWHGQPCSVTLSLPPLGLLLFRWTDP